MTSANTATNYRRASSTNKTDLTAYLPPNQLGYNLENGLHKKYPIPHAITTRDIGVKLTDYTQEDGSIQWQSADYKGINNIRPLDHITTICIKDGCSKGEIYNNKFENRMRHCAWKKSHHNKLHKGEPEEFIVASHLESDGPHYIGFEYQLIESHPFVDEEGNQTNWGPLTYLNVSIDLQQPYVSIINEMYGINSNQYSIGAIAMRWLKAIYDSDESVNSLSEIVHSLSVEPLTNEPQQQLSDEPAPNEPQQQLLDEPAPNEPQQPLPNNESPKEVNEQYDYDFDLPLDIDNDLYNTFNINSSEYSELKQLYTTTVQHNTSLINERNQMMDEKQKLETRLRTEMVKNKRLSIQLREVSTVSGIKPKSNNAITHYLTCTNNKHSKTTTYIKIKSKTLDMCVRNEAKYIFILKNTGALTTEFWCGCCLVYSRHKKDNKYKFNRKRVLLKKDVHDEDYFEHELRNAIEYHLNQCEDHKICLGKLTAARTREDDCLTLKIEVCYQLLQTSEPYERFEDTLYTLHRIRRRYNCKCLCFEIGDKCNSVAECKKIFAVFFEWTDKTLSITLSKGNSYSVENLSNCEISFTPGSIDGYSDGSFKSDILVSLGHDENFRRKIRACDLIEHNYDDLVILK